ncbi:helix-turn-helix transcriptional regulator [Streptomyces sp. MBT59]|uniref:helix-turn-helix transcriptional regulator n=1 Tax=Streptomyces sp. MBT59 TaxID=1488390 RepID=UPI001F1FC0DF|nr:helix-turn-helix transcriptional regulator [Streptomyces sp. MBT59]
MSARHFDRTVVRAVRRAAEIPQAEVGVAVDAADSTVAGWELGSSVPDQEKLPGIARVLRKPLDELFPRKGAPDLIDLRCDAGLYRYEVARFIGTKSDGPVAAAENGVRRLKEKYVPSGPPEAGSGVRRIGEGAGAGSGALVRKRRRRGRGRERRCGRGRRASPCSRGEDQLPTGTLLPGGRSSGRWRNRRGGEPARRGGGCHGQGGRGPPNRRR